MLFVCPSSPQFNSFTQSPCSDLWRMQNNVVSVLKMCQRCGKQWRCDFAHLLSSLCLFEYDSLHRRTGDERPPLLPNIFLLWLNLCWSCFLFLFHTGWWPLNTLTQTPPHTHVQTLGTEQYRGDFEVFLSRAACEGSQQAFTQTIYSRS